MSPVDFFLFFFSFIFFIVVQQLQFLQYPNATYRTNITYKITRLQYCAILTNLLHLNNTELVMM